MKKNLIITILICILIAVGIWFFLSVRDKQITLIVQPTPRPTPLMTYAFENLKRTSFPAQPIVLGKTVSETPEFFSQIFTYTFLPNPIRAETKTVSGLINIPKASGTYPVLVMLRGYIPSSSFRSGAGTQPSAAVFARNGFITIAPDFLGFGESDGRASDQFEARFQTYTTTLSLLASLANLNEGLNASYSATISADISKVGLWGHSNGGHIALATLAITGMDYPTVLWAPVSKSFPYSILAYTDEDDDQGKAMRKDLSLFEETYDTDAFSPQAYFDGITAAIEVHQGTADTEVPYWWSEELVESLKESSASAMYYSYSGSDHNMRPAWDQVVGRSLNFYTKHLK